MAKTKESFYYVKRSINDLQNNIHLVSGTYVRTENEAWVSRIGSSLQPTNKTPDDAIEVGETVESKLAPLPTRTVASEADSGETKPAAKKETETPEKEAVKKPAPRSKSN